MRRSQIALVLLFFALVSACSSGTADPGAEGPGIDVIDVSGPLDSLALEFILSAIEDAARADQELAVIQVNSRAVLDQRLLIQLMDTLRNPPLPVAVWLGPAPAVAYGGVAELVFEAPVSAAAPGSMMGRFSPLVAGEPESRDGGPDDVVDVEELDIELQPTIRQYLQSLDGTTFETAAGEVTISTLREFAQGGVEGVTLRTPTFRKPPLSTRFFRLAAAPEAAFFFLVVGLTLVTFEYYALGPGVAAGVAAISLWLGGWGIVNLPVRPWALAVGIGGWALLTTAYQRGGVFGLTVVGAGFLQVGGMFFVEGSGQIDPRWWLVLPSVLAALFFFLLAMPTVQRSRLSTQTIGREKLVGAVGTATSSFNPNGMVSVNGAIWRATAHREAGLANGTPIVVSGVDGLFLEVEPADPIIEKPEK